MSIVSKSTAMGFVAGALLVLLLDRGSNWLIRWIWPPVPAITFAGTITLTWQENLQYLSRSALPGGILGALTDAGVANWRKGEVVQAKRWFLIGGAMIFSVTLAHIASDLWSLLHTQHYVIGVPGPPHIAWQNRIVFFDLMLNTPLQWSLFLFLAGIWPSSKNTRI